MYKFIILTTTFFICSYCLGKDVKHLYFSQIKDLNIKAKTNIDTTVEYSNDQGDFYIKIIGNMDSCRMKILNKEKNIVAEGSYVNLYDTLIKYDFKGSYYIADPLQKGMKYSVRTYFQMLRNGEWKYYDRKGKLRHKILYKYGTYLIPIEYEVFW